MWNERNKIVIFVIAIVSLIALTGYLSYKTASKEKDVIALERLKKELTENGANLTVLAQSVKFMQKKLEEGRNKNFNMEIEKINSDLNINKALKKVNTMGNKKEGALTVTKYELKYEGLDINTLLNLLYRILNAPLLVRVEGCNISVSFDNANLLNLNLIIAHLT